MPVHIIYVPGLGDRFTIWRRFFLKFWTIYGITAELIPMNWVDEESYEAKMQRLQTAITAAKNKRLILIGESAGGSVVLNAYARYSHSLYKAMTICGKNTAPHHVSPTIYARHPAFKVSMSHTTHSVASLSRERRQNFISIHPIVDTVVPVRETLIPDCKSIRLWTFGHLLTILFCLTIWSWYIVWVAKRPLR